MKNLFLLSFALFASCFNSASAQSKLDADQAEKLIKETPNMQILDVRTPGEVIGGTLPNAVIINYHDVDFDARLANLDKTRPILVYCAAGGRSAGAAEKMMKAGFQKVYNLRVGFRGWVAAGKTVEKK